MTNFEGELEEMDNMNMDDAQQKQMMALFWSYLREDTYSAIQERRSGLESQRATSGIPMEKIQLEKLNIVCLKILDVFFDKNIAYINQELLFSQDHQFQKVNEDRYHQALTKFEPRTKQLKHLQAFLTSLHSSHSSSFALLKEKSRSSFLSNLAESSCLKNSNLMATKPSIDKTHREISNDIYKL